jgi:hypothetical protein
MRSSSPKNCCQPYNTTSCTSLSTSSTHSARASCAALRAVALREVGATSPPPPQVTRQQLQRRLLLLCPPSDATGWK